MASPRRPGRHRPPRGRRGLRRRLAGPQETVLVVDERAAEAFAAPDDDLQRLFYGYSVLCCLPAGMAEQPSAGTGTVLRPDTLRRYATEAGFRGVEVLPV